MYCYGNVFDDGLNAILASRARGRAVKEANIRMDVYCRGCVYFGACPGQFVGEATPIEEHLLRHAGCTVREVISYIVARLEQTRLTETMMNAIDRNGIANRALNNAL